MKTQMLNFTGGIMVGLILFTLLSASEKGKQADAIQTAVYPDDCFSYSGDAFLEVDMKEFLTDLARYYTKHAKVVKETMPKREVIAPLPPWESSKDKTKKSDRKKKFITKEPSRMFIYSLDTLKKFIGLVEKYGKVANIDKSELGIRFYYGVYPKQKIIAGEDYGSLHTLFMVPSHWNSSDNQFYDIEVRKLARQIQDMIAKSNPPDVNKINTLVKQHYLTELYAQNPEMSAFMLDASTVRYTGSLPVKYASLFAPQVENPTIINQGQLCPPNCPTFDLLTEDEVDW